jgi:hypothetical protein
MCDYSLHAVASRPAKAGDKLTTTAFDGTISRGFCAKEEPGVAICLMPGTELAFLNEPARDTLFSPFLLWFGIGRIGATLARFRKINLDSESSHHDALEFANGKVVLLTSLCEGHEAIVLQLPFVGDRQTNREAASGVPASDRTDA